MTAPDSPSALTVLTRDQLGNRAWTPHFARRHIPIYDLPCIETVAIEAERTVFANLETIQAGNWLIFSSAQGVAHFTRLVASSKLDRYSLTRVKIACVGQTTSDAVTARGLVVSFSPSKADALTLARELPAVKGRRVIVIGPAQSDPKPQTVLARRGASVTLIAVYETKLITSPDPEYEQLLKVRRVKRVIFASPSAVRAYWDRLSPQARLQATTVEAIAIGPTTARALSELDFTTVKISTSPSISDVMKLI
jgi:uroporphyrinogen-III synthase